MSRGFDELIKLAMDVRAVGAYEAGTIVYVPRLFANIFLPNKSVSGSEYSRRNGKYTLYVLAPSDVGIPYGVIPMLIIIYLCTQAKLTKSNEIFLGSSQNKFLAALGKRATGGKNGSLTSFKRQMRSLLSSSIKVLESDNDSWSVNSINLVQEATLLWQPLNVKTWESYIKLDCFFVTEAINNGVPVDSRVLASLAHYPLAFTAYIWLTARFFRLYRPAHISWKELEQQFGCNYKRSSHFKYKFKKALKVVSLFYPESNYDFTDKGLVLKKSKSHVSPRSKR